MLPLHPAACIAAGEPVCFRNADAIDVSRNAVFEGTRCNRETERRVRRTASHEAVDQPAAKLSPAPIRSTTVMS